MRFNSFQATVVFALFVAWLEGPHGCPVNHDSVIVYKAIKPIYVFYNPNNGSSCCDESTTSTAGSSNGTEGTTAESSTEPEGTGEVDTGEPDSNSTGGGGGGNATGINPFGNQSSIPDMTFSTKIPPLDKDPFNRSLEFKYIVIGGTTKDRNAIRDVEMVSIKPKYQEKWDCRAPPRFPYEVTKAVAGVVDNRITVCGGFGQSSDESKSGHYQCFKYIPGRTPTEDVWDIAPDLFTKRGDAGGTTVIHEGHRALYVSGGFGGNEYDDERYQARLHKSAELVESNGSFIEAYPGKQLPHPNGLRGHCVIRSRDDLLFVIGGRESAVGPGNTPNDKKVGQQVWMLDLGEGFKAKWKEMAKMKHQRSNMYCGLRRDNKIIVYGGTWGQGGKVAAELYDVEKDKWSDYGTAADEGFMVGGDMVMVDDKPTIIGGMLANSIAPRSFEYLQTGFQLNPVTKKWERSPDATLFKLHTPKAFFAGVVAPIEALECEERPTPLSTFSTTTIVTTTSFNGTTRNPNDTSVLTSPNWNLTTTNPEVNPIQWSGEYRLLLVGGSVQRSDATFQTAIVSLSENPGTDKFTCQPPPPFPFPITKAIGGIMSHNYDYRSKYVQVCGGVKSFSVRRAGQPHTACFRYFQREDKWQRIPPDIRTERGGAVAAVIQNINDDQDSKNDMFFAVGGYGRNISDPNNYIVKRSSDLLEYPSADAFPGFELPGTGLHGGCLVHVPVKCGEEYPENTTIEFNTPHNKGYLVIIGGQTSSPKGGVVPQVLKDKGYILDLSQETKIWRQIAIAGLDKRAYSMCGLKPRELPNPYKPGLPPVFTSEIIVFGGNEEPNDPKPVSFKINDDCTAGEVTPFGKVHLPPTSPTKPGWRGGVYTVSSVAKKDPATNKTELHYYPTIFGGCIGSGCESAANELGDPGRISAQLIRDIYRYDGTTNWTKLSRRMHQPWLFPTAILTPVESLNCRLLVAPPTPPTPPAAPTTTPTPPAAPTTPPTPPTAPAAPTTTV